MTRAALYGAAFLLCGMWENASAGLRAIPPLQGELQAQWSELGYYETDGISQILNDNFFVHPNGRTDPQAEYAAFVKAMDQFIAQGTGQETLCRFPARLSLIIPHLDWFSDADRPNCPDYQATLKPEQVSSISLLFANGYFDNPGSYYGHILLRFDYDDSVQNQSTLDASLNYGANITDSISSPLYLINGLFGGYEGAYKRNNSFIHTHNYTNGELRDVWEYQLNLTPEQQRNIFETSWELAQARFSYYFFSDNCAHRMLDLLERALGETIDDGHRFWLMPFQVVQYAQQHTLHAAPLITAEQYHPSLRTRLLQRLKTLDETAQQHFWRLVEPKTAFSAMPEVSPEVLLAMLDYYDLQLARLTTEHTDTDNNRHWQERRRHVLTTLLRRPPHTRASFKRQAHHTLQDRRPISRIGLAAVQRDGQFRQALSLRISNHDLLDPPMAEQAPSGFVLGAATIEHGHGDIDLREVTLAEVTNLNLNPLAASWADQLAWGVKIGYHPLTQLCHDCSRFGAQATLGKAWQLSESHIGYVMAGGRLDHRRLGSVNRLTAVMDSGIISDFAESGRLKLGLHGYKSATNGDGDLVASADYALPIGKLQELRFGTAYDGKDTMASVTWAWYWN